MPRFILSFVLLFVCACALGAEPAGRKPADQPALHAWLHNMAWHRFSSAEMAEALALSEQEVGAALQAAKIDLQKPPAPAKNGDLILLPYPGGRHPRIGFLDGAVHPQRETKFSVFTPWDEQSYVVVDLPEALWSNLGLTYLAHTHVDTIWTKQKIELPVQEWQQHDDGSLSLERKLPNGIVYRAAAKPVKGAVEMELTLINGTNAKLSDLRVQNCVMLKGARGFEAQTNDNKKFVAPFVAVRDASGEKWIITAWERCHNAWGNAPCPCLHSDPKFRDLAPGEQETIHGWVWFYRGADINAELKRLASEQGLPLN